MLFHLILPIKDLSIVHAWVKSLFYARKVPNLLLAGRLKRFLEEWEIITKHPEILEIVKGFKKPLKKSNTGESSPDATHGSETSRSNTSGDRELVEEGSHTTNRALGWGLFKQYFLGWEKRSGKSTCGELKILKPVHSIPAFQNGRFALPPRITPKGRLHGQARYERCLFLSSTASVIKELSSVFMVRESLRAPLLMF